MINDPIADMLTRIRNANQRRHKFVRIPYSKINNEIIKVFLDEGYIFNYKIKNEGVKKELIVFLKYKGQSRVISGLKRISKPGLRVYSEVSKIPKVLNGFGVSILSTSKGIMTGEKAKEQNLGGEVIAFIW